MSRSSHRRTWLALVVLLAGAACGPRQSQTAEPRSQPRPLDEPSKRDDAPALLRERVLATTGVLAGDLRRFYEARQFRLAWSDTSAAVQVLNRVARAEQDGLRPARYRVTGARAAVAAVGRLGAAARVDADLAVTQAWLGFAADLSRGVVVPQQVDSMWSGAAADLDLAQLLEGAVSRGRAAEAFGDLAPPYAEYLALRGALKHYRDVAARGGWSGLPPGEVLAVGASGERVRALRIRLAATGDLAGDLEGDRYDDSVAAAVERFQERHGLRADGRAGPTTVAQLNAPPEHRIRQIELAMERWRWLPRTPAARYIVVNSAAYELALVDRGRTVLWRRVIVGRPELPTPIVSGIVTHVVLNPAWNVPRSIAVHELLPRIRSVPGYLQRAAIRVYRGAGAAARAVDPDSVDWAAVDEDSFPYQLVQSPGPSNPLGRVKFAFANRFNICAHDTPDRGLFGLEVRTFSHGCVRVDQPQALAERLLEDDPAWPHDAVVRALDAGKERWIALQPPVPIHVGYWTAWVSDDGVTHFRTDGYGWDGELEAALEGASPGFTRD